MVAWYNEINDYAAEWLRNLIATGQIPPGDVDTRSIEDVKPDDLKGYAQCHFFAGIGGWPIALRLAGWPDDRPVWTGSCPCQPFSAAGEGKAFNDERHLWPAWLPLITERRPPVVFGEQVEAAIGWGWLDVVFHDLEPQGYACGATVLPACSVGAHHKRNRIWFVADASDADRRPGIGGTETGIGPNGIGRRGPPSGGPPLDLADAPGRGLGEFRDAAQSGNGGHPDGGFIAGDMGDAERAGSQGHVGPEDLGMHRGSRAGGSTPETGLSNFWGDAEWIACTDGRSRPAQPGSFPLAHGVRARTHKLRAYGNAIVPQVAAEFIAAYLETKEEMPQ